MTHFSRRDGLFRRLVSPDFVRVFQYHGTRGETPEQLAELLSHPKNFWLPIIYTRNVTEEI